MDELLLSDFSVDIENIAPNASNLNQSIGRPLLSSMLRDSEVGGNVTFLNGPLQPNVSEQDVYFKSQNVRF